MALRRERRPWVRECPCSTALPFPIASPSGAFRAKAHVQDQSLLPAVIVCLSSPPLQVGYGSGPEDPELRPFPHMLPPPRSPPPRRFTILPYPLALGRRTLSSERDPRSPLWPSASRHAPSAALLRRPTSGGPAYRGMGGIMHKNANDPLTQGWPKGRGSGGMGALPDGCSLRVRR